MYMAADKGSVFECVSGWGKGGGEGLGRTKPRPQHMPPRLEKTVMLTILFLSSTIISLCCKPAVQ